MPGLRFEFIRGPVWAKTPEQLRKDVVENVSPISGKPVMREIIENLTKPLTAEEKKTGEYKRNKGPLTFTGTHDELQNLFLEKRMTDFMPIILPTEDKVNEMLKSTSHRPDEMLGRMGPTMGVFETWSYTVKDAAVNAVMAGALPTHMPVLITAVQTLTDPRSRFDTFEVSTGSWAPFFVVNGPIRNEIHINCGSGALSPGEIANAAIGRALGLIIKNIGGARKGVEDMGVFGNPAKYSLVLGEYEEESPWEPLHVEYGFNKEDSTIGVAFPNTYTQMQPYGTAFKAPTFMTRSTAVQPRFTASSNVPNSSTKPRS